TANLTAKPVVLSTIQCMSAIQHNAGGILFMFSQAAPTPLVNPQRETPVPFPDTDLKLFSSNNILREGKYYGRIGRGSRYYYNVFSSGKNHCSRTGADSTILSPTKCPVVCAAGQRFCYRGR